jgi:hypothetical protein
MHFAYRQLSIPAGDNPHWLPLPEPGRALTGASGSYLRKSFAGRPTPKHIPMGKMIGRSRFLSRQPQQRAREIYCGF